MKLRYWIKLIDIQRPMVQIKPELYIFKNMDEFWSIMREKFVRGGYAIEWMVKD